jgi:hypothetical protein
VRIDHTVLHRQQRDGTPHVIDPFTARASDPL